MLTREQMIENINALERQGATQSEIQEWLNSLSPTGAKPTSAEPTRDKEADAEKFGKKLKVGQRILGGARGLISGGIPGAIMGAFPEKVVKEATTPLREAVRPFATLADRPMQTPWGEVKPLSGDPFVGRQQDTEKYASTGEAAMGAVELMGARLAPTRMAHKMTHKAVGAIESGVAKTAGKIIPESQISKQVAGRLTPKAKEAAYASGQMKEATRFSGEKYIPSAKDLRIGEVAQKAGLKGKSVSKDISVARKAIADEATNLMRVLKDTGAIYNKNTVKGILNKMKSDSTADLIPAELTPYNNYIAKFNKMVETSKNKGLDGLLEVRQKFDAWARSNNPNIFHNKTGGAYRALRDSRNSINAYLNAKVKDEVVKKSLSKQADLFEMIDSLAEIGAGGYTKLKKAKIIAPLKKGVSRAALLGAGYFVGKKGLGVLGD